MRKLYKKDTPLELLERIEKNYFNRKQVTTLTGLSPTQLRDLNGRNILSADYFIYNDSSYYSYQKLLTLKLMVKIRSNGNYRGFSTVHNADKFLKEYIDKRANIIDKTIILVGHDLYYYDFFNKNLISLTGKMEGSLVIRGIFDLSNLESELINDAREKLINSFQFKKENKLSIEEIQKIDEYVIN